MFPVQVVQPLGAALLLRARAHFIGDHRPGDAHGDRRPRRRARHLVHDLSQTLLLFLAPFTFDRDSRVRSQLVQLTPSAALTCVAGVLHQPAAVFDGGGAAAQSRPDGRPVVPVFLLQPGQTQPVGAALASRGRQTDADSRFQLLDLLGGVPAGGDASLSTDDHGGLLATALLLHSLANVVPVVVHPQNSSVDGEQRPVEA